VYHESVVDDIGVYYEPSTLRRVAAVMREVAPEILITHWPHEYMEDHSNTCRLALTAAFVRGMPNFVTDPRRPPVGQPVTCYHALPYGLRDPLRTLVWPELFVDISDLMDLKRQMLALHQSQRAWLDVSQGLGAYVQSMEDMCRQVGRMSGSFRFAEGWTRHLHLGYCDQMADPLSDVLADRVCSGEPSLP
jgi:LmbE family N-acetylglucosaminyl deacetylase